MQKYGFENMVIEIIAENLTVDEANLIEEKTISDLKTLHPNGYNVRVGGENYAIHESTKIKMSNLKKGTKLSEETKRKISYYNLNLSDEKRKQMSESVKKSWIKRKEDKRIGNLKQLSIF